MNVVIIAGIKITEQIIQTNTLLFSFFKQPKTIIIAYITIKNSESKSTIIESNKLL